MENTRNKTGLSLVEMLVVIAVVAILASIMLGVASHIDSQSKQRSLKVTLNILDSALGQYYEYWSVFPDPNKPNNPVYPSRSAALYGQLRTTPECREIMQGLSESVIKDNVDNLPEFTDPWGTVLDYLYIPGDSFPRIISAGPDKNLLTVGDNITNR